MYNSNNVAERIKNVAKQKGISVKKILEEVGLGFNTMSNMKTSMPKADNLAKIADFLDCSVDYLLGRTDVPEISGKKAKTSTISLEKLKQTQAPETYGALAAFGGDIKSNQRKNGPEIL